MRKAVLGCAVSFGLGPAGKLSSIVAGNSGYEWYACGNELDLGIYRENPFLDTCWSSEEISIRTFVEKYNIRNALVVLDPTMAMMLLKMGLRVIYVDSLPFMWTKADPIPYGVHIYCAQKFPGYGDCWNPVLDPVKNIAWVNPIVLTDIPKKFEGHYVVINFGGLHSPIGDGKAYLKLVLPALLEVVKLLNMEKIYITGGKDAMILVRELIQQEYSDIGLSLTVGTFPHSEFLSMVASSDYFFTSPGLTTIFETCEMDVKTFILPPQNLSQFHNTETAKQVYKMMKTIDWDRECLTMESLSQFHDAPEEQSVSFIYAQIEEVAADQMYKEKFQKRICKIVKEEFKLNHEQRSCFPPTGVKEITELMRRIYR